MKIMNKQGVNTDMTDDKDEQKKRTCLLKHTWDMVMTMMTTTLRMYSCFISNSKT